MKVGNVLMNVIALMAMHTTCNGVSNQLTYLFFRHLEYEGDTLHALVAGTDKLVSEIEIGPYQSYYKISDEPEDPDEFRVKLHNDLPDIELDIVLIYDAAEERDVWKAKFDNVFFDEDVFYFAYEGDVLRALVAGTETVVSDIEIRLDQSLYAISQIELESSEL